MFLPQALLIGLLMPGSSNLQIGLMLILKQLPHVFGYVYTAQDDLSYFEEGGATQFSALAESLRAISPPSARRSGAPSGPRATT